MACCGRTDDKIIWTVTYKDGTSQAFSSEYAARKAALESKQSATVRSSGG